ncbi:hypothetical protein ACJX0J_027377 [Zea mays]
MTGLKVAALKMLLFIISILTSSLNHEILAICLEYTTRDIIHTLTNASFHAQVGFPDWFRSDWHGERKLDIELINYLIYFIVIGTDIEVLSLVYIATLDSADSHAGGKGGYCSFGRLVHVSFGLKKLLVFLNGIEGYNNNTCISVLPLHNLRMLDSDSLLFVSAVEDAFEALDTAAFVIVALLFFVACDVVLQNKTFMFDVQRGKFIKMVHRSEGRYLSTANDSVDFLLVIACFKRFLLKYPMLYMLAHIKEPEESHPNIVVIAKRIWIFNLYIGTFCEILADIEII